MIGVAVIDGFAGRLASVGTSLWGSVSQVVESVFQPVQSVVVGVHALKVRGEGLLTLGVEFGTASYEAVRVSLRAGFQIAWALDRHAVLVHRK